MGIEALPSSTVRTIGATQVLNDPAAVIKELVDNALDAQSTSISVEIHSNTVDSIQVRDNGHGIPPEDRMLVARRHYTSKITGEDDLKAIGGISLGFRGEALASVAEISGTLTISTRVEGEEVASALKVSQQGEVLSQSRASLPVGTTVRITDFIKTHPVRRQMALKNSEKTITAIKQKLTAYAFARPLVRLSLRVLKAKNDKGSWTYAPKAGGNAEDATFKIVGAACASQCTWSIVEDHGYFLQAFLPRPDKELSKCGNVGSFISIDARPVSTTRGVPKQIQKIFREALKRAAPRAEAFKDPFLVLDMRCPLASYDANVEPAKDDVLFEDADVPLSLVRQLFDAVYSIAGRTSDKAVSIDRGNQVDQAAERQSAEVLIDDDFFTSLEPAALSISRVRSSVPWLPFATDLAHMTDEEPPVWPLPRSYRSNMYGCDEEDLADVDARPPTSHSEADMQELRQARHDVNVYNPWILAKMNATVQSQPEQSDDRESSTTGDSAQTRRRDQGLGGGISDGLPTPGPSSPVKAHPSPCHPRTSIIPTTEAGRFVGSQDLQSSTQNIAPLSLMPANQRARPAIDHLQHTLIAKNVSPDASADLNAFDTPWAMIPQAQSQRKENPKKQMHRPQATKPFKLPGTEPAREKVWFDHLDSIGQPRPSRRPYQHFPSDGLVSPGELGEPADDARPLTPPSRNRDVRDYFVLRDQSEPLFVSDLSENRQHPQRGQTKNGGGQHDLERSNGDLIQRKIFGQGGFVRASALNLHDDGGQLPHGGTQFAKHRKTSERRALGEISGNASLEDTTAIEGHDENTRNRTLLQTQCSTMDGKTSQPRRTNSSRLPLERVPKGQGTHNLGLELSTSMREVFSIASKIDKQGSLLTWNETSLQAYHRFATALEPTATADITATLETLLAVHVPGGQLAQDLGSFVQNALAGHAQAAPAAAGG